MIFLKYITLIQLVVPTRSSLLFDTHNPNGIRMSEYCPKMKHCEEGTHVLCMYYDPVRIMGPACSQDAHNVTASEDFKTDLLEIVNEMRRRVTKGEEVGQDNQPLPRAYGMQKLEWDHELAVFAQIWANQCTMRHDLCRATKRFHNPGQITSIFRFSFPDWQVLSKVDNTPTEKFLTDEKVILAMRKSLRNAYKLKKLLTKEMINSFPDFKKQPELESSRIYLTIVDGKSTHVGCGISAFSDYYGQVRDEDVIHNVVEIVCNFATQPTVGEKVYETEKPKGNGFSSVCGCPPGFVEDDDCFCIKPSSRAGSNFGADLALRQSNTWCHPKLGNDKQCRPTVVLVPIFKMEDAPRNKLYKYRTTTEANVSEIYINNPNPNNGLNGANGQDPYPLERSNLIVNKLYNKYTRHNTPNIKKRYFNRKVLPIFPGQEARRSKIYQAPGVKIGTQLKIPPTKKRESIFTRASKFKLPVQNKHQDNNNFWINSTKSVKQVKPRKDFSKVKDLVSAYIKEKKHKNTLSSLNNHNQMNTLVHSNFKLELNHSVVPNARKLTDPNHKNLLTFKKLKKGDNKLLHLLDSLELEMQHTELNRDLKDMVDAKIRKIYGSVVSENNVHSKSDRSDILDNLISKLEKKTGSNKVDYKDLGLRRNREDENIFDPTSTPKFDILLKRNQNAISLYDRPNYKPFKSRLSPLADINNIYDSFLEISKKKYAKDDFKRPSAYSGKSSYDMHNEHELSGLDKIKYFQEKQEELEKKLQSIRNSKHRYELQRESSQKMRPVFISRTEPEKARSTSNFQNFYVPDRAKFLHSI